MAKLWSAFYDEVITDLPGTPPQTLVSNAIRNSTIEFCDRSFVYRIDHVAISAVATVAEYAWAPGANLKVVRPELVWYDKKPLIPKTLDEIGGLYPYWPDQTGTPIYFIQEKIEQLILIPKPTASLTNAIRAKVSIKPARAATDIIDEIWEKYLECIAYGAKYRLLSMNKKPWTDLQMAGVFKTMYEDHIAKARLDTFKGRVKSRNNQNLGFRRFL